MHVIHAIWSTSAEHGSALHLWAEAPPSSSPPSADPDAAAASSAEGGTMLAQQAHAGVMSAAALRSMLEPLAGEHVELTEIAGGITLRLPSLRGQVLPSPALAHATGHGVFEEGDAAPEEPAAPILTAVSCPCVRVAPRGVPILLDALEDTAADGEDHEPARLVLGESVRFYAAASRLVRQLLAQHRFVPMILQESGGTLRGSWMPWEGDSATMEKLSRLVAAMPPSARAAADAFEHHAFAIIDDFVSRVGDALARHALTSDGMADVIESRVPADDAHVALLTGLLRDDSEIETAGEQRGELVKGVRRWIGGLEERGAGSDWRLLLRLGEPLDLGDLAPAIGDGENGVFAPGDDVRWTLSLHLQSLESPTAIVDASDIWLLSSGAATVAGMRLESPQETLLAELGRAARLYKRLEKTLEESDPAQISLSTSEAYRFLREVRPILIEQGINVEAPQWWDSPTVRLGARLQIESEDVDFNTWTPGAAGDAGGAAGSRLGMTTLVNYRWQMAVGTAALTLEQFERLAAMHSPLVRLNGQWVEIRPEDIKSAMRFVKDNPGGRMELGRALRLAFASEAEETGVPVIGMDATGWVAKVFTDAKTNESMPLLTPPEHFVGTLRPYQIKGLSWLAFLDRIGLGACLADDMGLGKTIQLLALLSWERQAHKDAAGVERPTAKLPPTLLIVPTSVAPNWVNETKRFTPDLAVMIHHGPDRLNGERLAEACAASDLVVTTYALAYRDRDDLEKICWGRVVLDEAQNIKNPGAKQTRAIHNIPSPRRVALTGTPVENRLGELWSIMDFLNPGYLGPATEFRRKFAVPIERFHDKHRGQQLRGLVQPFVLRRLKSDPAVITDLPEKVESKEYCFLTPEQASLYQTCVNDMLNAAEKSEGIQRRGVVLAGLIKLKQICNHPGQFLKEWGTSEDSFTAVGGGGPPVSTRSGKCQRLVEMLEEVVAAGDKALVFTQFRQMGHALAAILRHALDREVLLLHGGTPPAQRQVLINRFQKGVGPTGPGGRPGERTSGPGGPPIFVLSLKAGGVGLNLTAASHVFHFDRWWNPAVESQATDRAFRIGQTRTVQVHKFVVSGTLEERIDQMIEQKMALADEVIGAGEQWLTELSTGQLRDMLVLREGAIDDAKELMEVER